MGNSRWLAENLLGSLSQIGQGFQRGVGFAMEQRQKREAEERAAAQRAHEGLQAREYQVTDQDRSEAFTRAQDVTRHKDRLEEIAAQNAAKAKGFDLFAPAYRRAIELDPDSAREMVELRNKAELGEPLESERPDPGFVGPMPGRAVTSTDVLSKLGQAQTRATERKGEESYERARMTREAQIEMLNDPRYVGGRANVSRVTGQAGAEGRGEGTRTYKEEDSDRRQEEKLRAELGRLKDDLAKGYVGITARAKTEARIAQVEQELAVAQAKRPRAPKKAPAPTKAPTPTPTGAGLDSLTPAIPKRDAAAVAADLEAQGLSPEEVGQKLVEMGLAAPR